MPRVVNSTLTCALSEWLEQMQGFLARHFHEDRVDVMA
jgi:hypothetical protein